MIQPIIGVFDSGLGGLSVLKEIRALLPDEPLLYLADQQHVPYGSRSLEEVRRFSEGISRFLIELGIRLIVVACNTASAAALHHLRKIFPDTPFVGMEPAVKPAAISTKSQKVGVLATPATFQGKLFASVVERFGQGVEIIEQTLPGLVERIEAGDQDSSATRAILKRGIEPLIAHGVDTLVLACTHYPFVLAGIREVAGAGIQVIDPSPAIAQQTKRLFDQLALMPRNKGSVAVLYYSTSNPELLVSMADRLIHLPGEARHAIWKEYRLATLR
jgi:glutamate racemase